MTTPTDPTARAPMTGDALIRGTRPEVAPVEGGYFDLLVAYADRLASGEVSRDDPDDRANA